MVGGPGQTCWALAAVGGRYHRHAVAYSPALHVLPDFVDDAAEFVPGNQPGREEAFGKKPIPVRSGGSIPIISTFEKELGIKSILMGFGLDEDAIHSPNENYPLYNFFKGIETIPLFYKYYSEI